MRFLQQQPIFAERVTEYHKFQSYEFSELALRLNCHSGAQIHARQRRGAPEHKWQLLLYRQSLRRQHRR